MFCAGNCEVLEGLSPSEEFSRDVKVRGDVTLSSARCSRVERSFVKVSCVKDAKGYLENLGSLKGEPARTLAVFFRSFLKVNAIEGLAGFPCLTLTD